MVNSFVSGFRYSVPSEIALPFSDVCAGILYVAGAFFIRALNRPCDKPSTQTIPLLAESNEMVTSAVDVPLPL
jgi:hypothetical protein